MKILIINDDARRLHRRMLMCALAASLPVEHEPADGNYRFTKGPDISPEPINCMPKRRKIKGRGRNKQRWTE